MKNCAPLTTIERDGRRHGPYAEWTFHDSEAWRFDEPAIPCVDGATAYEHDVATHTVYAIVGGERVFVAVNG